MGCLSSHQEDPFNRYTTILSILCTHRYQWILHIRKTININSGSRNCNRFEYGTQDRGHTHTFMIGRCCTTRMNNPPIITSERKWHEGNNDAQFGSSLISYCSNILEKWAYLFMLIQNWAHYTSSHLQRICSLMHKNPFSIQLNGDHSILELYYWNDEHRLASLIAAFSNWSMLMECHPVRSYQTRTKI